MIWQWNWPKYKTLALLRKKLKTLLSTNNCLLLLLDQYHFTFIVYAHSTSFFLPHSLRQITDRSYRGYCEICYSHLPYRQHFLVATGESYDQSPPVLRLTNSSPLNKTAHLFFEVLFIQLHCFGLSCYVLRIYNETKCCLPCFKHHKANNILPCDA